MTHNDPIYISLPSCYCLHATSSHFVHPFWMISWFDILGIPLHLPQILQPPFIVKVFQKARLDLPIHLTRLFLPIPLSEVITMVWPWYSLHILFVYVMHE